MSQNEQTAADRLVGVLVAGHGQAASGLLSAARLIAGEQPASAALDLGPAEPPDGFGARLAAAAGRLDRGGGVLVLADLPGATPFTAAARLTRQRSAAVVAGVNLPMLLEVLLQRAGRALDDVAGLAESAGRAGVVGWPAPAADTQE